MSYILPSACTHHFRHIPRKAFSRLRAIPGADILCIYQRPGEGAPYLAPLSGEKGVYTLVLADTDVALPGFARMELRAEKGGKIVKSAYFTGEIAPALRAPGERPDAAAADTMDRIAALQSAIGLNTVGQCRAALLGLCLHRSVARQQHLQAIHTATRRL